MSALRNVHPLVWYATAYGGTAALLKGIGFVVFLWLARYLPVEDYATFGLLYALQTVVGTLAMAGIGESVVGLLKDHESLAMRSRLFGAANAVFMVMGLVSIALALLFFGTLSRPSMVSAFGLASVMVVGMLSAFLSLQTSLVRLEEKHLAALSLGFFGPLGGLVGGLIGFLNGQSVSAFFLGSALGLSFSTLVLRLYGIGFYGFVSSVREASPILLRIAPFIGLAFLGWLNGYGANYIVEALFESLDVAKYTFAVTLTAIVQLVAASLLQVWSPRFYRIVHEQSLEEVEGKNRKFFRWQAITVGFVGGVVVAIFPLAIDVIGGNLIAYRGIQTEIFLLFASYVVLSPWWHCQLYFLVHGKGQEMMGVTLRTSVIGISAWLLLMWLLGPLGIYLGFLVLMLLRMLGIVVSARRHWPLTIAWDGVVAGLGLLGVGFAVSANGLPHFASR